MPSPAPPAETLPADVVLDRDVDGPPVVLVHGFSQTRRSWDPLLPRLSGRHLVVPDLPGHGAARHDDADLTTAAALLTATGGPGVYVGYSMGGRVALRAALDHPTVVRGMVLVGATAGIDDDHDRTARRRHDAELAEHIERDGTVRFLDEWLSQPLFAGLDVSEGDLRARRANRPEGLASSLRRAGTGTMDPPWWDELHRIGCPTLVVAGERDLKFSELGRRLVAAVGGNATMVTVPGAGHAAHLERPDAFCDLLSAFLAGVAASDQGM